MVQVHFQPRIWHPLTPRAYPFHLEWPQLHDNFFHLYGHFKSAKPHHCTWWKWRYVLPAEASPFQYTGAYSCFPILPSCHFRFPDDRRGNHLSALRYPCRKILLWLPRPRHQCVLVTAHVSGPGWSWKISSPEHWSLDYLVADLTTPSECGHAAEPALWHYLQQLCAAWNFPAE